MRAPGGVQNAVMLVSEPERVEGWVLPGEAEAARNGQTVERAESAARHAHR